MKVSHFLLLLPSFSISFQFITPQHTISSFASASHNLRHFKQQLIFKMSSSTTNDNDDLIEKERAKSVFRYTEDISPGLKLDMSLSAIHHTTISDFQQVQVIDTHFGRTLVTDGKTQSAQHDEAVYHESLVHPSLFWSTILSNKQNNSSNGSSGEKKSGPKRVFIGGGGELATAREVLKHTNIERLVMVDIDPVVIDVCKKYLPEWGGEAVANHPKMELIVGDAHEYIMETSETFDVIIMDISDPIEAGPGIALYTKEFYERASQVLTPHSGVFVTQAGSADYVPHIEEKEVNISCFSPIRNTLASVFDHAIPYTVSIASFGEDWGFVMAFNGSNEDANQLVNMASEDVDALIDERIEAVDGVPEHPRCENDDEALKVYDGETHRGLFSLSKPLRKAIANDKRIMTKANPIFMY